jgi:hypothetical protein
MREWFLSIQATSLGVEGIPQKILCAFGSGHFQQQLPAIFLDGEPKSKKWTALPLEVNQTRHLAQPVAR